MGAYTESTALLLAKQMCLAQQSIQTMCLLKVPDTTGLKKRKREKREVRDK